MRGRTQQRAPYHEKVISAGFSAIGSRKCEAVTVPMGRMAAKYGDAPVVRHEGRLGHDDHARHEDARERH